MADLLLSNLNLSLTLTMTMPRDMPWWLLWVKASGGSGRCCPGGRDVCCRSVGRFTYCEMLNTAETIYARDDISWLVVNVAFWTEQVSHHYWIFKPDTDWLTREILSNYKHLTACNAPTMA